VAGVGPLRPFQPITSVRVSPAWLTPCRSRPCARGCGCARRSSTPFRALRAIPEILLRVRAVRFAAHVAAMTGLVALAGGGLPSLVLHPAPAGLDPLHDVASEKDQEIADGRERRQPHDQPPKSRA